MFLVATCQFLRAATHRLGCVISHISTVVLLPVRVLGNRCATLEQETLSLAESAAGEYNTERPHSSLGYRPPAPQAILPKQLGHGDMENAPRFPHPHTPGDYDGQVSSKALH